MKFILILTSIAVLSPSIFSQDNPAILERADKALEQARAKARKPLTDLMNNYEKALKGQLAKYQSSGKLDEMLAVKKEIENFRDRSPSAEFLPPTEVAKLWEIYDRQNQKLQISVPTAEVQAIENHIKNLSTLVSEFARKGELKQAVVVQKQIEELKTEVIAMQKTAVPESAGRIVVVGGVNEFTKAGIQEVQTVETADGLVLTSGGNNTRILSNETISPPFKIITKAKTNSLDIRIHFGTMGVIVFNSKERPGQLWMHHPVTHERINADRGTGKLKTDQWHQIEVQVKFDEIEIFVGGRAKGLFRGNFSDATGPIGIGPAHFSKVTVESFYGEEMNQ